MFWFAYRLVVWYSYRAAMKFCGFKFASDECPLFNETPSPVFDSALFEVVPVMAVRPPNSISRSRPMSTPAPTFNQRDSEVNPGALNFRALSLDDVRAALDVVVDNAAATGLAMPEPRTRLPTVVSMGSETDAVPDRSTIFSPVNGVIVEEDATPTILQVILSPTYTAIWGEDESRVSAGGPASDAADDRTPALSRSSSFTSLATYMAVSGEDQSRVSAWGLALDEAADDRTPALSRSSSFTSVATFVTAVSGEDQPRVSARGPALDAADDTTPALSRSSSFASVARPLTPV
jgi:hypothetical protein